LKLAQPEVKGHYVGKNGLKLVQPEAKGPCRASLLKPRNSLGGVFVEIGTTRRSQMTTRGILVETKGLLKLAHPEEATKGPCRESLLKSREDCLGIVEIGTTRRIQGIMQGILVETKELLGDC
jgi:hypothetical protein